MNKEFNLSEMIVQNVFINVEDVKEFIRLLKEKCNIDVGYFKDLIDKLSGDELI